MKSAAAHFSLNATLESGQIFRWEKEGGWYYVTVGDTILKIRQQKNKITYNCSNRNFDVPEFFGLKNRGYALMLKKIGSSDKTAAAAIKEYRGLRLIRQEPWECTASFICSSFSNIKRIKKNLNAIAETFGKKMGFAGYESHSFPAAASIAENAEKLGGCGIGYRKKYLASTARKVSNGFNFNDVRSSSYETAKKKIMELDGVGEKVADCILLFSLGFSEAFPVDVWVEKIMKETYFGGSRVTAKNIAEFGRSKFGKNAGYAQQFLYHYARNRKSQTGNQPATVSGRRC